jgi:hypothetical protein
VEKHDERRVTVADCEVSVSRFVEGGKDAGFMLKTVPSGTLQEDFFSEDGRSFFRMSSSILHSGELEKYILLATPIPGAALVLLLRQALTEWAKGSDGYARQIYSPDPVAIRLHQERVNAPGHADWGHVNCQSCGDTFALGYNRIFGNKAAEAKYLARFEDVLADEHQRDQLHQDAYELGIW